jgi:hypothetical protein
MTLTNVGLTLGRLRLRLSEFLAWCAENEVGADHVLMAYDPLLRAMVPVSEPEVVNNTVLLAD